MSDDEYRSYFPPSVRLTAARRAVIDILSSCAQPGGLSAGEIYAIVVQGGQSFAQASIYRILGEIVRQGSADQFLDADATARYRLRDASQPWGVCIVADQGEPRLLHSRRLFEAVARTVLPLGLRLSPTQVVTIRVG